MSVSAGKPIPPVFVPPTAYEGVEVDSAWLSAHPSVQHFRPLFAFDHLPEGPLRQTLARFSALADYLVATCPSNAELAAGLRKLREAKDCAVTTHVIDRAQRGY